MNDYWLDSAAAAVADASFDEDGFLEDERKEENVEDLVTLRELGTDFLEGELVYDESSMRELNLDKFEWLDAANNDAPLNNDSFCQRMDYSAESFTSLGRDEISPELGCLVLTSPSINQSSLL